MSHPIYIPSRLALPQAHTESPTSGGQPRPATSSSPAPRPEGLASRGAPVASQEALPPRMGFPGQGQTPARPAAAGSLSKEELPLAGYLFARAADSRHVDDPQDVAALRSADESVRETRALLDVGRGNVVEDIEKGGFESNNRLLAHRELDGALNYEKYQMTGQFLSPSQKAGVISSSRVGNCGEFSTLAAALHADKLKPDEVAMSVHIPNFDHVWTEVERPIGENGNIVLDAWTSGPAVFEKDAVFTSSGLERNLREGYRGTKEGDGRVIQEFALQGDGKLAEVARYRDSEKQTVRDSVDGMAKYVGQHKYKETMDARTELFKQTYLPVIGPGTYLETPVLAHDFADRVLGKVEEVNPAPNDGQPRIGGELRNELMAVYAARSLGESVASAVGDAPRIVEGAREALQFVVAPGAPRT
jgi:hypothetical protein